MTKYMIQLGDDRTQPITPYDTPVAFTAALAEIKNVGWLRTWIEDPDGTRRVEQRHWR